jgi:hydrogenase expression/formation protein HypE
MSEIPEIGKISPDIFSEIIYPRLGAKDNSVVVGPQNGVDVGIIELSDKSISFTTDPVFIVPEYGWERAAWFAIHILASDSATSGLKPRYLTIDLNLPMRITKPQLLLMWDTMHKECEKLGISIITGHTARYENCEYPFVGGATVIGFGGKYDYVTPKLASAGDKIIITKGPAIEASGILATMFPKLIEKEFGEKFNNKAQELFYKMSVVEDAMTAVSVGTRENGVTAMHDATECGIWGALIEIAQAADLGVRIERENIVIEECVEEICRFFNIDPYSSISEGTLIIACKEYKSQQIVDLLNERKIKASIVGELTPSNQGKILVTGSGERQLKHPVVDPFWNAFYRAKEKYK